MTTPPVGTDPRLRAALRRLDLRIVHRLEGLLHGEHLGLRLGPGSEISEARLYQPGEDDVRHMDWAVTARTTVPHVRDLVSDRELESWTLLDLSPSMDFGTGLHSKREIAVGAMVAANLLTQRIGDRFGAHFLHRGTVRRWPARSGKEALLALLATVAAAPRVDEYEPSPHRATLADAVEDLVRTRRRRGLRVVISDFLDTPAFGGEVAWERPMRLLASRHQVLVVEVIDPRELDVPEVGDVALRDPRSGLVRDVRLTRTVRERYRRAALAQREAVRGALRRSGVHHLVLRTDRDWVLDTARFVLEQRRTAHRLARHTPGAPR
ncbi:DUF58 domain-containing protein [Nocardiopsis algeriensis]|uniref:Uncharacterized protein (DUF58 family) n=1 Tax=Nocardiopsis algeriensis TaxID=1478215 RepID=A0A841IPL7_9ACTN|nr:DUF58 domain-containing protein [Nocardiopsis algeriensis]MBB6120042.1 uncharacterized protein (DUF58 family) [Nocardiopsis algeriensis]